jgi:16S rRNA (cytosine967-C5)-methyltransferase
MTPAARTSAAVELLGQIEAGGAPADRITDGFFRSRRYAGSKDRAEITERVYAILRRRAELSWRLGQDRPSARALVLAGLARVERLNLHDIEALFAGGRFGPAALDDAERKLVADLWANRDAPPDWVRGSYPLWMEPELKRRFGPALVTEMAAQQGRAPVDLRVNTLKATREQVLETLAKAGIEAEPTRYAKHGIRLGGRARIAGNPVLADGLAEVQDEGSQLVAELVDPRPGQWVLDLCAGAGGKTLAMAAAMRNKGQVHALDVDQRRLAALTPRLRRAGADNVQPRVLEDRWLDRHRGRFDRVLIDAPCSGTGTWRRDPDQRQRLNPDWLERTKAKQAQLLERAAPLVKPGGRLVYATCSLLPGEDEDQVDAFLAAHPDFARMPVGEAWAESVGGQCPTPGPDLLLTPKRHATDGFYAAILARKTA